MKKFNGFENYFLKEAGDAYVKQAEAEILAKEKDGKNNSLFAPGYFTMVWKDMKVHIDDLTLKQIK